MLGFSERRNRRWLPSVRKDLSLPARSHERTVGTVTLNASATSLIVISSLRYVCVSVMCILCHALPTAVNTWTYLRRVLTGLDMYW